MYKSCTERMGLLVNFIAILFRCERCSGGRNMEFWSRKLQSNQV